jgi:long-chain acyl-CoA synthetase
MTNLAHNLRAAAASFPDRIALQQGDALFTYTEFNAAAAGAAAWLGGKGVRPGDRVAVMIPNAYAFPIFYYAILRGGAIVVPMNPLFKSREIEYYLTDSGAKLALVWSESAREASRAASALGVEMIEVDAGFMAAFVDAGFMAAFAEYPDASDIVERADYDTAVILYTSGTTGNPKGAELTHGNLHAAAQIFAESLLKLNVDDVVLGSLPLFHVFGQTCVLNASVIAGSSVVLIVRFEASSALEEIENRGITVVVGVPTMYIGILAADPDTAKMRTVRLSACGGAPLPAEVARDFNARFGLPLLQGYGLSESTACATFSVPCRTRVGSVGHALEGVEVRIVDDSDNEVEPDQAGELAIRGKIVMKGYWNRPFDTRRAIRDSWLYTGDIARKDSDGFLYIVDRSKDVIIRGGYNVYPREVEEVLYEHPAVFEAAVIGVPHSVHGEEVVAVVALKSPGIAAPDELQMFAKERLAPYKYPRRVVLVDGLPHGSTGKILKREIVLPAEPVDVRLPGT